MSLADHIEEIRSNLRAGRYVNEASVSSGIIMMLLKDLGWPVFDPQVVAPQFTVEARRVDFALCHPPGRPKAFIEVKNVGQTGGADRQLFEYAFHTGVPLAVLTDGQEWHFYLPAEQGHYEERRVYKLDILERDAQESVQRLTRYLEYRALCSGSAIEAAKRDFQDVTRERLLQETLPKAWRKLIEEQDDLLVELLADKVESVCGYKPSPDAVSNFLHAIIGTPPPPGPKEPLPPPPKPGVPISLGFRLNGQDYLGQSARGVMIQIFEELSSRDSTFLERFAARPRHGRSRRYIAQKRSELYPGRADLEEYSHQLRSGWWLGTNYSKASIEKIVKMACEVAGITFGRDLTVNLGG